MRDYSHCRLRLCTGCARRTGWVTRPFPGALSEKNRTQQLDFGGKELKIAFYQQFFLAAQQEKRYKGKEMGDSGGGVARPSFPRRTIEL